MKYPNIKAAHLSHADIAKAFGYKNAKSFNCSSAHKRHMEGVETILKLSHENIFSSYDTLKAQLQLMKSGQIFSTYFGQEK